jgi:murein DD-endopeptidase MepM/ murein hydrolase activator NlpD
MRIPASFKAPCFYVRLSVIGLTGFAAAACSSDTSRFNDSANSSYQTRPSGDVTSSTGQNPGQPVAQIESRPLDQPAYTNNGTPVYGPSVYSQNGQSYQPNYSQPQPNYQPQPQSQYSNAPHSVPAAPAPQYSAMTAENTASIDARPAPTGPMTVTLKRGETLHTLSSRYSVSVAAIMKENNFADASRVRPGTKIVIPSHTLQPMAASLPMTNTKVVHTVAPHETLTSIAHRYNIGRQQIAYENKINEYAPLKIGQKLTIPGATVATAPVQARRVEVPAQPQKQIAQSSDAALDTVARVRPVTPQADADAEPQPKTAGSAPSFRWPVKGRVISNFGGKPNGQQNDGINISVPENTAVKASEDGVVAYAGNELKGYGNLVLIRHAGGWVTAYAHNSEVLVHKGETVKRGQVISKAGQTGGVASPQLHFEIRQGSTPVDPAQHLSSL